MEMVTIDFRSVIRDRDSDAAILFDIEGEEIWIPRSLIDEQDSGSVDVPKWFARKEGLL